MPPIKAMTAALALSLFAQALGAVIPNPPSDLTQRDVPVDDISKYTIEWFLDSTIQRPELNECVFYTEGQSGSAQSFANSRFLATIWSVWAPDNSVPGATTCSLYNDDAEDQSNPLRGIMADETTRMTYFSQMSQAYAELCSGVSFLMSATPNNVPTDGIWSNTEFPTIMETGNPGGQVDLIGITDSAGASLKTFWRRPGTSENLLPIESAAKRASKYTTCLTPDQIEEKFGDINW